MGVTIPEAGDVSVSQEAIRGEQSVTGKGPWPRHGAKRSGANRGTTLTLAFSRATSRGAGKKEKVAN